MTKETRKINCFIASAFGHDDVDRFYDEVVLPVLKDNNIEPFIVNRIVHNDNIDNKILELIDNADFAIADLTYARPSVYYEAGYAERNIQVIYTVRKDHFKERADDPKGNLIVHFDLNKKNIISWSASTFLTAKNNLDKRIKFITRPIKSELVRECIENNKAKEFSTLNIAKRLERIHDVLHQTILQNGYKEGSIWKGAYEISANYIRGYKNDIIILDFNYVSNMTKNDYKQYIKIKKIVGIGIKKDIENQFEKIIKKKLPRKIILVDIFICLSNVKTSVPHSVFPTYTIATNPDHIYAIYKEKYPLKEFLPSPASSSPRAPSINVPIELHICKVDGLPHEEKYRDGALNIIHSVEALCV